MSEEGSFGAIATEKFFGVIILIIGIVAMYYTLTSIDVLMAFAGLFSFLSLILIILGVILIIVKAE